MIKILVFSLGFFFEGFLCLAQDPFSLYLEKDDTWKGAIFHLYIRQYSGIQVSRFMIEYKNLQSIEEELLSFPAKRTTSLDEAIAAANSGKKVFFFIGNNAWGGLEHKSIPSTLWGRTVPIVSGFYNLSKRTFKQEALSYHCSPKNETQLRFIIME